LVTIEIKEKHQRSNTTVEINQCIPFDELNPIYNLLKCLIYKIGVVTIEIKEKHQHSNTTVEINQCIPFDEF